MHQPQTLSQLHLVYLLVMSCLFAFSVVICTRCIDIRLHFAGPGTLCLDTQSVGARCTHEHSHFPYEWWASFVWL